MRALALTAVVLICACAPSSAIGGSAPVCGGPSSLVTPIGLAGSGAKAGPLVMRDFPEGSTDATIRGWKLGNLEKVLIRQVETSSELVVRGERCSDGHVLRFWYRDSSPLGYRDLTSTPVPNEVLDTMGDSVLHFDAFEQRSPAIEADHPGYMLFTSAGDWQINVWDLSGRYLGAAVLRVATQP